MAVQGCRIQASPCQGAGFFVESISHEDTSGTIRRLQQPRKACQIPVVDLAGLAGCPPRTSEWQRQTGSACEVHCILPNAYREPGDSVDTGLPNLRLTRMSCRSHILTMNNNRAIPCCIIITTPARRKERLQGCSQDLQTGSPSPATHAAGLHTGSRAWLRL
jgi:hypothetical protein